MIWDSPECLFAVTDAHRAIKFTFNAEFDIQDIQVKSYFNQEMPINTQACLKLSADKEYLLLNQTGGKHYLLSDTSI